MTSSILLSSVLIQTSMSVVMVFTAVSKFVTTLKDHTTASVLVVMNSTVMAIHVMVRMADMLIQIYYHADSLFHFTDVIECATGIDECNQNCHNTDGSYSCSCDPGYTLYRDNLFCYGNLTQA